MFLSWYELYLFSFEGKAKIRSNFVLVCTATVYMRFKEHRYVAASLVHNVFLSPTLSHYFAFWHVLYVISHKIIIDLSWTDYKFRRN
jgi:hypothetical protein